MKHESVQHLFDQMAQSTPEQVAISCGDTRITYGELQQRTDKLAHLLLSGGAKKGSIVAILLDNKVDAITSIIAVLKAGCCICSHSIRCFRICGWRRWSGKSLPTCSSANQI